MNRHSDGFTLIEVAIVVVIIGLLAASILTGQSLIRNAELQRIIDAKTQLVANINIFRSRYGALPGDFDNRTGALFNTVTNAAAPGGDNNGIISFLGGGGSGVWDEVDNVYADLSLAGLLPTSYATANLSLGCVPSCTWNIGTDSPATPQINTVFWVGAQLAGFYGRTPLTVNTIMLTGPDIRQGALRLQDAMSIDYKFDDGVADTGTVRSYQPWGGVAGGNGCVTGVATTNTAVTPVNYLNPDAVPSSNLQDCVVELGTI